MRFVLALLTVGLAAASAAHGGAVALLDVTLEIQGAAFQWRLPAGLTPPVVRWPAGCRVDAPQHVACPPAALAGGELHVERFTNNIGAVVVRFEGAAVTAARVTADARSPRVPLPVAATSQGEARWWSDFATLGVFHLLTGPDHLLFLLGLVLLTERRRRALATTTAAFTVGHSLTLALVALRVVVLPATAVEVVIALSLVLLAREVARPAHSLPTVVRRHPALVALLFGLVHGLGFAGGLAALALPQDAVVSAVLGFNLGLELAQLAVVALFCLGLRLLERTTPPWLSIPLRAAPAYAIGVLGCAWTFERLVPLVAHGVAP